MTSIDLILGTNQICIVIYPDIIENICKELDDKYKNNFLSITKSMTTLKNYTYINKLTEIHKIYDLYYRDRFTNLIIDINDLLFRYASLTKSGIFNNVKKISITGNYRDYNKTHTGLPPNITHLYFNVREIKFDNNHTQYVNWVKCFLKNCKTWAIACDSQSNLPLNGQGKTITHLTLGQNIDKDHDLNDISESITHLTIDRSTDFFATFFDTKLFSLPPTVTHLTFGWNFNEKINKYNLPGVTHLTFGEKFRNSINGINNCSNLSKITHLTFGKYYDNKFINKTLLPSLTHLIIGN